MLILDEPTAGLDPRGPGGHSGADPGLSPEAQGTTVILVSHSMEEIARNVDRIVVLNDGSMSLWTARPGEVFSTGRRAGGRWAWTCPR